MIRTLLFLVFVGFGTATWLRAGPAPIGLPDAAERDALARSASETLAELREVASTWLELPDVSPSGSAADEAEVEAEVEVDEDARELAAESSVPARGDRAAAAAPDPRAAPVVERVTGRPSESEWSGVADAGPGESEGFESGAPQSGAPDASAAAPLEEVDVEKSGDLVRRLLAIYARLEDAR